MSGAMYESAKGSGTSGREAKQAPGHPAVLTGLGSSTEDSPGEAA